jgi:hypothetical protein
VSDRDKAKMAGMAASLTAAETDEEPSEQRRQEIIAWVNSRRSRRGTRPLSSAEPPEEEFYRRARALGLLRR